MDVPAEEDMSFGCSSKPTDGSPPVSIPSAVGSRVVDRHPPSGAMHSAEPNWLCVELVNMTIRASRVVRVRQLHAVSTNNTLDRCGWS